MANTAFRYTGAEFGGTAITSFQSADWNQSSSVTDFSADAQKFVVGAFVDDVVTRITVVSADPQFTEEAAYAPGTTGVLVLSGQEREGAAAGGTVTQTFSNAVLVGASSSAEHTGAGSVTLEFAAYSADGTTNPLAQTIS